jgi:serine/threonine protein kinase
MGFSIPCGAGDGIDSNTVKRYEILDKLGEGGMGVVFRARQIELDRVIAIKFLHADAATPIDIKRFEREIGACKQLQHPNIIRIFDSGEMDGQVYFAMELIDNALPLDQALTKRGRFGLKESVNYALQLLDALRAVHALNLVHRDIKPANILMRADGSPVLMDFGLVRQEGATVFTEEGSRIGTPRYMAPEMLRDGVTAPSVDIWAIGLVLYDMLTGERAFPGHLIPEICGAILRKEPIPPSQLNSEVPASLDPIVLKFMVKDPADRVPTAAKGYQLLAQWLDDYEGEAASLVEPGQATIPGQGPPSRRKRTTSGSRALTSSVSKISGVSATQVPAPRRYGAALAAVFALMVAGGSWIAIRSVAPAPDPSPTPSAVETPAAVETATPAPAPAPVVKPADPVAHARALILALKELAPQERARVFGKEYIKPALAGRKNPARRTAATAIAMNWERRLGETYARLDLDRRAREFALVKDEVYSGKGLTPAEKRELYALTQDVWHLEATMAHAKATIPKTFAALTSARYGQRPAPRLKGAPGFSLLSRAADSIPTGTQAPPELKSVEADFEDSFRTYRDVMDPAVDTGLLKATSHFSDEIEIPVPLPPPGEIGADGIEIVLDIGDGPFPAGFRMMVSRERPGPKAEWKTFAILRPGDTHQRHDVFHTLPADVLDVRPFWMRVDLAYLPAEFLRAEEERQIGQLKRITFRWTGKK